MNVFEFAKKMELDGAKLYSNHLKKANNDGLKHILQMLIKQEEKHYELFDLMEKESNFKITKASFKGLKNVFEEALEHDIPHEQLAFYKKAEKLELKSEKFYREIAEKEDDDKTKKQILIIADEEHNHSIIFHQIIEHIERPNKWVDNPEFNHMEDY